MLPRLRNMPAHPRRRCRRHPLRPICGRHRAEVVEHSGTAGGRLYHSLSGTMTTRDMTLPDPPGVRVNAYTFVLNGRQTRLVRSVPARTQTRTQTRTPQTMHSMLPLYSIQVSLASLRSIHPARARCPLQLRSTCTLLLLPGRAIHMRAVRPLPKPQRTYKPSDSFRRRKRTRCSRA